MTRISRPFDRRRPVYVYRNLAAGRSKRIYSVMQDGRVVRHVSAIMLRDVTFIVREKARQRVLQTGRKAVHAFAKGWVIGSRFGQNRFGRLARTIQYNPYNSGSFTSTLGSVVDARTVILNQHGMTAEFLHTVDYFKGPAAPC